MLKEGYELKLGSGKDRSLLVKFMCTTYEELFPEQGNFSHLVTTVERYFSFDTPLWWVVTNGNNHHLEPVGCVWLGKAIDQVTGKQTTHIFLLYVKPEHRRCGIGRALMEQAQKWAIESGDRLISLMVYCTNEKAIKLYKSLGYQNQSILMFKEVK